MIHNLLRYGVKKHYTQCVMHFRYHEDSKSWHMVSHGSSWHWRVQCHRSCHEKLLLGDAKSCQLLPASATKKPAV